MKKMYIHVGPHKTGSTITQKFLLTNQSELSSAGLLYPSEFLTHFGHHELHKQVLKREVKEAHVKLLRNTGKDILVSSENFISLSDKDFEYIKSVFKGYDIRIIYSWRRTSLKLYSVWQEVVKHGGTESFYEYYYEHIARPNKSALLNPVVKLDILSKCFGKGNVLILDYNESSRNKSLIEDFLTLLGCKKENSFKDIPKASPAHNKSLSAVDAEVLRGINSIFKFQFNVKPDGVRNILSKHSKTLSEHGLDDLKALITKKSKKRRFGDYFIDNFSEREVIKIYKENIVNYNRKRDKVEILVPSSTWLFDKEGLYLASSVAKKIRKILDEI